MPCRPAAAPPARARWAAPCTLTRAFAAAADADDIRLAVGHVRPSGAAHADGAERVRRSPRPGAATRPVLHDSNATSATALLIDADGVTLRGLRVEGSSTGATDDLVAFAGTRYGGQVESMEIVPGRRRPGAQRHRD